MGAHDDKPVTKMETSVLSQSAFQKLGVQTIGELCATSSYEFMEAAYACAADDQRVAPALSEVSQILADMGLALRRDALGPLPTEVAKDGPAVDGWNYLGSIQCGGALVFGERRFLGEAPDPAQDSVTMDVQAGGAEGPDLIRLGRVDVEPGVYDVYTEGGYRARRVALQHRILVPAQQLKHIGALRAADPLVAIVDAEHNASSAKRVRSHAQATFDWGCTAVLAFHDQYEWTTFTALPGGPIARLELQAGAGE